MFALPVDGHHRKTAAAAAGERGWRHLLSSQGRQHTGLPPKEVRDQPHELNQGYAVIPAGNIRRAEVMRKSVIFEISLTILSNSQRSHEVTQRGRARDVERDQGGHGQDLQGRDSHIMTRGGAGGVCEQGGGRCYRVQSEYPQVKAPSSG